MGGRYDNLIPGCSLIGMSFGVSRIVSVLKQTQIFTWKNLYYLTALNGISLDEKLKYWKLLENKYNHSIMISDEETNKKLIKIITYCVTSGIKYLYVLAPDELKKNQVIIKDLEHKTQSIIDL